jgi:crotonobetainyl-CoA:carnitine CoA-transferase CaiB-like acyl-CoA transferase
MASGWMAINGNKRSLTLDLQKKEAKEIIRRLVAEADVVMENFRPGVMDRLGLGYEALRAINPRIIYACISGFGQTGPDSPEAGYDGKIQAMSGIMSITGHEETGPVRAGFAVCDTLTGMTCAFGVASALFQRTHTGVGQFVDVSMLDATLAFLPGPIADWTVAGHKQKQSGNQAVSRKPTANLFKAKDGWLLLAVNNDRQYDALLKALGLEHINSDTRFADWFLRVENEPALRALIEEKLAAATPTEWEERLNAAGAPSAAIWRIEEVIEHRQVKARGLLQEVDSPWGRLRFAGSGVTLAHGTPTLDKLAPLLGADTDAILAQVGFGPAEIAALRDGGVV